MELLKVGLLVSLVALSATFNKFEREKYLCKGECEVMRSACSCMEICIFSKTCCSDYGESCLNHQPWHQDDCTNASAMTCPGGFDEPPVILFSIDGFKAEYIYRHLTPNIWKLASCGVHAPYMRAVYPTKTFPNHHTIATGLYPESHGIIDKKMYDHDLEKEFFINSEEENLEEARQKYWWGGEPIWVTAANQGKTTRCHLWPGCSVDFGVNVESEKFSNKIPNEQRMYKALEWLDQPKATRPSLIILYMEIVDTEGHTRGPDSQEMSKTLEEADGIVEILMNGLKLRGLENCINLVMLADHGMSLLGCDRKKSLEEYNINLDTVYYREGAFGRIGKSSNPTMWYHFDARATHNALRCHHEEAHWQSFLSYEYLPKRPHYANNKRIDPVNLIVDDGWVVEGKKGSLNSCGRGTHGFDNEFKSMHALFAAHGPSFKRGYNTTEPFEAIEVYNLLTDLLSVTPAPNNGTSGSLSYVLTNPKPLPPLPTQTTPDVCDQFDEETFDSTCEKCEGIPDRNMTKQLRLTPSQVNSSQTFNMPYGRPHVAPAGRLQLSDEIAFCILTQLDYVIAYDKLKNLPFFASFTLEKKFRYLQSAGSCIRTDPRLSNPDMICKEFEDDDFVAPVSLYPSELSNGNSIYDAAILSNKVPMYRPAATVWRYMGLELAKWADQYGGVNVVAGPVFDYDYNGVADSKHVLERYGTFLNNSSVVPIPTHFFLVVTRCSDVGSPILQCKSFPEKLEVLSFLIPNYAEDPCRKSDEAESSWIPHALKEHVARIRDIELLTGISFLTSFTHSPSTNQKERVSALRVMLRLPQFTSQWLTDFTSGEQSVFSYSLRNFCVFAAISLLTTHFVH